MAYSAEQLEFPRRRVAGIDRKYANGVPRVLAAPAPQDDVPCPQEWLPGQEVENENGRHYQTTRFWERHRRHGNIDMAMIGELPEDLLNEVSEGTVPAAHPRKWAFLDTETTGLAGGTGTCAFLIGLGWICEDGFRLRQYLLREPGEEASALESLEGDLEAFDVLVTYNGKAFDQPLLESRFRLKRRRPPFTRMAHMDLLYGARRLWKLRFDNCRLMELENQILGVERENDVPGELVPYLYFEYLRKKEIFRLVPVFHHNAIDILTLACLTAIVPWAFRDPEEARLTHGAEMVGVARWMRKAERWEDALRWMRQALRRPMRDELAWRTLWDVAQLERKLKRESAAVAVYSELAGEPNPFQALACEELAKYYEHKERNYEMALDLVEQALGCGVTDELRHRAARLRKKAETRKTPRLL